MVRRRGIALLEIVAALTILAGVGFTIGAALRAQTLLVRQMYEDRLAWEAAAGQIELLESAPPRPLEAGTREIPLDFPGWENLPGGKCVRTVTPSGVPGLFRITVRVTWEGFRSARRESEASTLLGEAP